MDCILPVFCTYTLLSIAFLRFPIRKRPNKITHPKLLNAIARKSILHISHRGGSREKLENTLEAFDHAYQQKTDMFELDVSITKDEQVIIIHDEKLDRMCGVDKFAFDYNYNDLPKMLRLVTIDFSQGELFDTHAAKERRFPLLEELFIKYPDMIMNIDLKTSSEVLNDKVNQLIKKYKRENITFWGAKFQPDAVKIFKLNQNILRFACFEQVIKIFGFYITGLLPFINIEEDSFCLPFYTNDYYLWKLQKANKLMARLSVNFFGIYLLNLLCKPMILHLNRRGILVNYWVLNHEQEITKSIQAGANGIMTDRPSYLREYLNKK